MDGGSSEDEEETVGANQGVRVVKRLPFTRENAETLMVETSDGELVDVEKTVATKMSLAIRKKIGTPPPPSPQSSTATSSSFSSMICVQNLPAPMASSSSTTSPLGLFRRLAAL